MPAARGHRFPLLGLVDGTDHSSTDYPDDAPDAGPNQRNESRRDGNESFFALLTPQQTGEVPESGGAGFYLARAVPNPARDGSLIHYGLSRRGTVTLAVFSVAGREIRVLENGAMDPGDHTAVWDGRDAEGTPVASGLYFYRLEAEGQKLQGKLVFVR